MSRYRVLVAGLALLALGLTSNAQEVAGPKLSLVDVQVAVLASDGSKVVTNKGNYPSQLLSLPQIPPKHTLEVTATVTSGDQDFKPQQIFLVVQDKATKFAAYAVGKLKKGSTYSFSIAQAAIHKQASSQGGKHEVYLIAGDPSASQGVQWKLGEVEVLPAADAATAPAPARRAGLQPVNNIKPVIHHMFRPADKRPPAAVSLAFTGAVALPLVVLVGYLLTVVKPNFNGWPRDAAVATSALAFHGLLAALLGLYLLFWLRWNLAQTLPVALALGGALAFVGHRALSGLATERLALKKDCVGIDTSHDFAAWLKVSGLAAERLAVKKDCEGHAVQLQAGYPECVAVWGWDTAV